MRSSTILSLLTVCVIAALFCTPAFAEEMKNKNISFTYTDQGIAGIASPKDPFEATVTNPQRPLSLTLQYQVKGSDFQSLNLRQGQMQASPETGIIKYTYTNDDAPLKVTQTFTLKGDSLNWDIDIENTSDKSVKIGDLAISIPAVGPRGESPKQIFENGFVAHSFISGDSSFIYYVRACGAPPFLIVTAQPGTPLEYSGRVGRAGGAYFIHSGYTGGNEKRGTWRQPHTFLDMSPAGTKKSKVKYSFALQFADSYDGLRDVLYNQGLLDVRAVPGMTIPEDLTASFSLRTKAKINSIGAEFPDTTKITLKSTPQKDTYVYEIDFKKLGENKITINHDNNQKTYLEYFVTEPMETLIKKRASFIINRQQIRDPNKWWDGVFGPYDMKNEVVRSIDDPDIFTGRMIYVLTCDDPGLCKAPYVASKNVAFPDKAEIEGLEYYLENFVWGKMQRTDEEEPYPYGVYGTPNWYIGRDLQRRIDYGTTTDLDKEHVWRSYDYPHIVMLYFHMYEIAKKYPEMSTYLDAAGYLQRAWRTAKAFYEYPYAIYPSYYDTYKWGLYNELVVLDLIDALEREGFGNQAAELRGQWEIKVKYFVYDDEYPFRSEYAFDRTAFESTYAFAKYGATTDMKADEHLWYDEKLEKWYSHPSVKREDSRNFMDRQLSAGLCVRGWLETNFNQLGADSGVSYMAAMGGWGVLDYGINFADKPYDWLQLGYASYLSSWCLMNTGTEETDYGYWYPGKQNDGASGWQFMSAKVGRAWMGGEVTRGPWHYDGEIDLGYGGALRSAATIITNDPTFGWYAYGGKLTTENNELTVIPRDGLRQRLAVVLQDTRVGWSNAKRFKIELGRDGFAKEMPIVLDKKVTKINFILENRTADKHITELKLSTNPNAVYKVFQDGVKVELKETGIWDYPYRAELQMNGKASKVEITLKQ